MPVPHHPALALALLSVSACLAVTACGAGGDPLSGLSGGQVAARAFADLGSQAHFTVTGKADSGGQAVTLALGYAPPSGCQGKIGMGRMGSADVVTDGGSVWVRPDSAYWKAVSAVSPQQLVTALRGKYVKTSVRAPGMAEIARFCTAAGLSATFGQGAAVTKGSVTTAGGQRVLTLTDARGGTLTVTDTAAPRILTEGGRSPLTFAYGPVTVTPPPASETASGYKK